MRGANNVDRASKVVNITWRRRQDWLTEWEGVPSLTSVGVKHGSVSTIFGYGGQDSLSPGQSIVTSGTGSLHWVPATSGTRQVVFVLDAECLLPAFEVSLATYLLSFIPYLLRIFLTLYNVATHRFVKMLGLSGMSRQTLSHLRKVGSPLTTIREHTHASWTTPGIVPMSLYHVLDKSPFVNGSKKLRSHIISVNGSTPNNITLFIPYGLVAKFASWRPRSTSLYIARILTSKLECVPKATVKHFTGPFCYPLTDIGNDFKISLGKSGREVPWMVPGPGIKGPGDNQHYFNWTELCWDEKTEVEDRFVCPSNIEKVFHCTWENGEWQTRSAKITSEDMGIEDWEKEDCGCFAKFTCLDNYNPIEHSVILDCGDIEVKWALNKTRLS